MKISSPTIISFSGGRTSGMMLKLILDAHDGVLPDFVKVVFANTGKEMPQTLDFVNECSVRWNVPIVWLEYQSHEEPQKRWREVSYQTASRSGEPFADLITHKNYLPNPTMRFCTIELKIRVLKLYTQQVLGWKNWDVAIGFRADEQRRVAKLSAPSSEPFERYAPLAKLNITAKDVGDFWNAQEFDLHLPNMNGKTMHGNCDLCFLKGAGQTLSLISENSKLADWWIAQESRPFTETEQAAKTGKFRKDRPSYFEIKQMATNQGDFYGYEDVELADCGCTD
jgi:3'-phosphoadenosine 5'-phosphosulfate sulfotransferase (PAPS reductase)/FAD synthetase